MRVSWDGDDWFYFILMILMAAAGGTFVWLMIHA